LARTSLVSFFLVGLLGCAGSPKRDGPIVRELEIRGARQVDPGELRQKILTAKTSKLPFTRKQYFDRNVWRTDLRRIERFYQGRGFYQARVLKDQVVPLGKNGVKVIVDVEEGRPTQVAELELTGLDDLPPEHRGEVTRNLPFQKGDVFLEEPWEGLPEKLEAQLRNLGYAEVEVSAQAGVDLETQRATLRVAVTPGLRYRIGDIHVKAQPTGRVPAWRVVEQAREAVEGEDWYSDSARDEVQARIFKMGVFGAAKVTAGQGNPETGTVPLEVDVQEAPFHTVRGGFGVGFEQSRNDAHVVGEYTHRDFLGGLRKLTLRSTAGYAFIPNAYTVVGGRDAVTKHGVVALVSAELQQPRLLHPNFTGLLRVELEREIEPGYSDIGARFKLGTTWQPFSWLAITPSYNFEVYRLDSGEASLGGSAPTLLYGCPGVCVLSYLEQRVEVDRRDDKQDPRAGYLLGLALQEGGGVLGGSFQYLRVMPEARGYLSFLEDKRLTFSLKVRVGTLIPASGQDLDSPIVARFFSGGDGMRGFSTRRLSPMGLVQKTQQRANAEYNAEPSPIGGNGLFEAQLEARYSLTQNLRVAAFVDSGFVTTESVDLTNLRYFTRNALVAVGGGFRYLTPVGPIRLDLAYRPRIGPPLPVYPVEGQALTYEQGPGCFGYGSSSPSRGGAPEGPCSIHLSIGEAF
jgi:translocation and assembly module TamA